MRPTDTWARKIGDLGSVPKIFRDFLPGESAGAFPYTVYAPTDRWGFRKSHPKLFFVLDDSITFLELGRAGVARRTFPFAGVTRVEMGRILLHAWIKVSGVSEGQNASVTVEFNSVVEDLFRPVAETIRAAAAGIPPAGEESLRPEWEKLDFLAKISIKFANFAKLGLIPGEEVLAAIFEPDIRQKGLFGLRTVVPTHLVVLTDREMILISDDRHRDLHQTFGGIWSCMPLGKIGRMHAAEDEAGNPTLQAELVDGTRLDSRFSASNREELHRLQEAFAAQRAKQAG